ncbi:MULTISPECIES: acyl-CoA thioesterase [Nostocales]|uniref:Thioesterase n=3 Tax=Nostocales TaxID=1161 RepID=A0A0C1N3F6_9CYAN|nr:thioesterase family protein [Tolypothrix bouteillei]KAF3885190.1 acyl-CoA thioesterase [Tolypothrix bouteillei VB521301]
MKKILFELEVYPFHIDFIGHVNNNIYIQWMEIGRIKLLEAVGMPLQAISQQGFVPVLVQTNITYKSPFYLGDRVRVEMWISELKNASAIMQFRFYKEQETLAAEGWQKGLFVDRDTMRPRRLSPEERSLFIPYTHSTIETESSHSLISVS